MNDVEIFKLFAQGGFAGALLFIIWKLGSRIDATVERVGQKLDGFGTKIDDHTKIDVASLNDVRRDVVGSIGDLREDVAVVGARQQQMHRDWVDQLTPVSAERYREEHDDRSPTFLPRMPSSPITRPQDPEPRMTGEYSVRPGRGRPR